jgi:hypothetical protein
MNMDMNPSSINDDETLKPERKKLKLSAPDLKITVGGRGSLTAADGGDVDVNEKEHAVEHWYHSIIMANHSTYIDTMLASSMKESKTREISFPDIAPATWQSMMKFLDNPLALRLMTVGDVMELAPLYHKYDFPKGLELSGHVLKEYIQAAKKADHAPDDIDFLVDAILLADACDLDEALNAGVHFIDTVILHYDRNIFSKDHIAKLAPLFAKEETLFATVQLFIKSGMTKDNILHNPFFAELLVDKFASYQKCVTMLDLVGGRTTSSRSESITLKITMSGSGCSADGDYIGHFFANRPNDAVDFTRRGFGFGGQDTKFMRITVRDDIWVIVGHQEAGDTIETIFWERPDSYSLMVPPRDGWVPVDINALLAFGKSPKLMYQTHEAGRSKDST